MSKNPESKVTVYVLSLDANLESFCCFGTAIIHEIGYATNSSRSPANKVVVCWAGGTQGVFLFMCTLVCVVVGPIFSMVSCRLELVVLVSGSNCIKRGGVIICMCTGTRE